MANFNSSNSSSTSSYASCQVRVTHMQELFYLCCLGPAIFIILVLAFLNKRISYKKQACNGQPGLVVPFDFFSGHKNRITIAMAFGATAGNCLIILFPSSTMDHLPGPPWVKVFQGLVIVLHFGIINYPFFACLTTDHRLVGSSFGFIYSTTRFVVLMVVSFECKYYFDESIPWGAHLSFYSRLPTLLCQLFLVIRFFVLLIWSLRRIMQTHNEDQTSLAELCLATVANLNHVRTLFCPMAARNAELQKPWYVRFRDSIYKPKPEFKFSIQMISTVVVGAIILYAELLESSVIGLGFLNICGKLCWFLANSTSIFRPNSEVVRCQEVISVTNYCLIAAVVLSAVLSVVHLVHLLACHRRHVYLLYNTRKLFFKGSVYSPARLVGRSLSYSGYQIAYTAWGFIIAAISVFVVIWLIALVVVLMDSTELKNTLYSLFMRVLPVVGFATFVWIFQYALSIFVFRDRSFPNITVAVDNRQVFCIMSYFFFFFNIIVGMIACFMRIVKGALLGVVFLARIDRTSMIEGFYSWDPGYMAYLGHVYFYVAHHHPVLLVFCQLLVDSKRNQSDEFVESLSTEGSVGSREESRRRYKMTADVTYGTIQRPNIESGTRLRDGASYTGDSTPFHKRARMSQRGYNRWFLAWTLMKNPRLISQRSKGRSASRPVYLVNPADYADDQLLVP